MSTYKINAAKAGASKPPPFEIRWPHASAAIWETWREIQKTASASFFVSSHWAHNWYDVLSEKVRLRFFELKENNQVIALGILCIESGLHNGFKQLFGRAWLGESGDPQFDCVTIEHNGLLCLPGRYEDAIGALFASTLLNKSSPIRQIKISGLELARARVTECVAKQMGAHFHVDNNKPYFMVKLSDFDCKQSYLDALSRNTRYQINKSLRGLTKIGLLTVNTPNSQSQAEEFLQRLIDLHQTYWKGKSQAGAFSNAFFCRFHLQLVRECWKDNVIQLLEIKAGSSIVGYLYNFVFANNVYAYQSGFNYQQFSRFKPGIVSHVLAIEQNIKRGLHYYDFLAGDSQYKQSLSTSRGEMVWLSVSASPSDYYIGRAYDWLKSVLRRAQRAKKLAGSDNLLPCRQL